MSSLDESRSLLRDSSPQQSGGSGGGSVSSGGGYRNGKAKISSAPGSASNTPAAHPIRLEDHRPGRRTTFSLLVGSSPSPPLSPHSDREQSLSRDRSYNSLSTLVRPPAHDKFSLNTTPYRYGDGTNGYHILFPTPEETLDESAEESIQKHIQIGIWLSLVINVLLFVSKTYSAIVSRSLSVAASAVDSFLDLASQLIVFLAERGSKDHDSAQYPAGRSRLEPVGIILCAALMGMAALQLILESGTQLYHGYILRDDEHGSVSFDIFTLSLLVATIIAKLGLWIYCAAYAKYSPTLYTLAIDHRNDVLSNAVALVAAVLAWRWKEAWSADPIGAILMSVYICLNWFEIGNEQIEMIVGKSADPEFVEQIRQLSANFHAQMVPDIIRAYHFGSRYLVELEVILPADMTVREAHDISLALQQSIEQLPSVERAFVHVDYKGREGEDEHNAKLIAVKAKMQTPGPTNNQDIMQLP